MSIMGSQGEHKKGEGSIAGMMIFKEELNIKWHALSNKKLDSVRFLPAFDASFNVNDDQRKYSYIAYRERDPKAPEAMPGFTGWYGTVKGHQFWGPEKLRFLTPATGVGFVGDGIDPIMDVYNHVKGLNNASLEHLWKPQDAPLKIPREMVLANALVLDDKNNWQSRLLIFNQPVLEDLQNALKTRRGLAANGKDMELEISKDWAEFLIGDITSPQDGSYGVVNPKVMGGSFKSACIEFFDPDARLTSRKAHSFDPTTDQGKAILAGRHEIENIIRVQSYAEVLQIVVNSGLIERELIVAACSKYCEVPQPDEGATTNVSAGGSASEGFKANEPATQENAISSSLGGIDQPESAEKDEVDTSPNTKTAVATEKTTVVDETVIASLKAKFEADAASLEQEEAEKLFAYLKERINSGESSLDEVTAYSNMRKQEKYSLK